MTSVENKRFYHGPGIYVGRPSKFGNPIKIRRDTIEDRSECLSEYIEYVYDHQEIVTWAREELKDATLICWCAPKLCHAHVLAWLAEGGDIEVLFHELSHFWFYQELADTWTSTRLKRLL